MDRVQTDDPGPMTANVHGYQPMHGQRAPNGLIAILGHFTEDDRRDGPLPGEYGPDFEKRLNEKFIREAGEIYSVLSNNLPGGTLHQLLIRMLHGKLNLYVVSEDPYKLPDRLDIERLAVDFVHEPENWTSYVDCKETTSAALPPEWFLLCRAVEAKYGEPKVEIDPPTAEVAAMVKDFEANADSHKRFTDEENREITQMMACTDLPHLLLIQVDHDDSEWTLIGPKDVVVAGVSTPVSMDYCPSDLNQHSHAYRVEDEPCVNCGWNPREHEHVFVQRAMNVFDKCNICGLPSGSAIHVAF